MKHDHVIPHAEGSAYTQKYKKVEKQIWTSIFKELNRCKIPGSPCTLHHPVVTKSLAMHGPVTRSAVGVLLIDFLIDRSRDVGSTSALVQDRRTTVPVRLVARVAVDVAGGNPALAADGFDAKVHVHVVDALEG